MVRQRRRRFFEPSSQPWSNCTQTEPVNVTAAVEIVRWCRTGHLELRWSKESFLARRISTEAAPMRRLVIDSSSSPIEYPSRIANHGFLHPTQHPTTTLI